MTIQTEDCKKKLNALWVLLYVVAPQKPVDVRD